MRHGRADEERREVAFRTTIWEQVHRAQTEREALSSLFERYVAPLRAHLEFEKKLSADNALELIQEFFTRKIVSGDLLKKADPKKGRFRTFLLSSLNNFRIDRIRSEHAEKRAPDRAATDLDLAEYVSASSAVSAFDVVWAFQVLRKAVDRMRVECQDRPDLWALFEGRVHRQMKGEEAISYERLATNLDLASAHQASNHFQTAQRRFIRLLGEILAEDAAVDSAEEFSELQRVILEAGPELMERLRRYCQEGLPEVTACACLPIEIQAGAIREIMGSSSESSIDLATTLERLLTAPVLFDLGDVTPELGSRIRSFAESRGLLLKSFADILQHPNPSVELLELTKDFAKQNRSNPDSPLPPAVSTVLYYAAIAAALVKYDAKITQHDESALREGFSWVLEQSWVNTSIQELVRASNEKV